MSKSQEDFDSALIEIEKTCKIANNGRNWDITKVSRSLGEMVEAGRITAGESQRALDTIKAHKPKASLGMVFGQYVLAFAFLMIGNFIYHLITNELDAQWMGSPILGVVLLLVGWLICLKISRLIIKPPASASLPQQ